MSDGPRIKIAHPDVCAVLQYGRIDDVFPVEDAPPDGIYEATHVIETLDVQQDPEDPTLMHFTFELHDIQRHVPIDLKEWRRLGVAECVCTHCNHTGTPVLMPLVEGTITKEADGTATADFGPGLRVLCPACLDRASQGLQAVVGTMNPIE